MKEFLLEALRSLSWVHGILLIMMVSAVLSFSIIKKIKNNKIKWILSLVIPYMLSHVLYWSPVWLGANPSEYAIWAMVCIIPWTLSGLLATVLILKYGKSG